MSTFNFLTCWMNPEPELEPRSRSSERTLKHIIQRRYATDNLYTVSKLTQKQAPSAVPAQLAFRNKRFYRANCDFVGYDSSELTFAVGDFIEVDEAYRERYIYRGRHVRNGLIGYVSMGHLRREPIIELQPWYFYNITRHVASVLLLNSQEVGTFLVRKSNIHGQYALSIRDVDGMLKRTVKHYRININMNGYYISEGCYSKHLDGLIQKYQDDVDGCLCLNPRLSTPCVKDECFNFPLHDLEIQL